MERSSCPQETEEEEEEWVFFVFFRNCQKKKRNKKKINQKKKKKFGFNIPFVLCCCTLSFLRVFSPGSVGWSFFVVVVLDKTRCDVPAACSTLTAL